MNPRHPGLQPGLKTSGGGGSGVIVNYTQSGCLEITKELVSEFLRWVRDVNPSMRKQFLEYSRYVPRLQGLKLCGREDVGKVFKAMGGLSKSTYEAFSRFLTFLDKTSELDELVSRLRKGMPRKPKTREDTYVPPDDLVLRVRDRVKALGPPYTLIYDVLVSTGCRGTEARYLVENVGRLRAVRLGGYVRVHVDLQRGSKNEFVMYLPTEVYNQLLSFKGGLPHQNTVKKVFREAGLPIKYFRKWFRQKLKELGIDSEDIEALQGRVSSIGGRHYTDWVPILDRDYAKILPHIRKYIIA